MTGKTRGEDSQIFLEWGGTWEVRYQGSKYTARGREISSAYWQKKLNLATFSQLLQFFTDAWPVLTARFLAQGKRWIIQRLLASRATIKRDSSAWE
jgi:hypothetical protein